MNTTIITELFLYFARFVQKEGVLNFFNLGASPDPAYEELKQKIEALPEHSLLGIQDYAFGANLQAVRERVNNIHDNYLFVDFGEIDCGVDRFNRFFDNSKLAVTVASRLTTFTGDLVTQAIAFDRNLQLISDVRNTMIRDQAAHPWLKDCSLSHTFVPFVSPELLSIGWTLMFSRDGYDSFAAKKV